MPRTIVAIGGGEIKELETFAIDKHIVSLTKKKSPKLLFIPTASKDSAQYYEAVKQVYDDKLNCETSVLYLTKQKSLNKEMTKQIATADIIYVGGGNTLYMMNVWRRLGVDILLKQAWERGVIMCGLSAGSICWFTTGNSDSRKYANTSAALIKVTGLGLVDGFICPHYDAEKERKPSLQKTLSTAPRTKILALDNCAAVEITDDTYRIITSSPSANGYLIHSKNGKYTEKILPKNTTPIALSELFTI
jgi:dipeptidase E